RPRRSGSDRARRAARARRDRRSRRDLAFESARTTRVGYFHFDVRPDAFFALRERARQRENVAANRLGPRALNVLVTVEPRDAPDDAIFSAGAAKKEL